MPIHLNPFRLYKGRLCLNHGILVEILRSTKIFWIAYKNLLELTGKRESADSELRRLMKQMDIKVKKRISNRQRKKILIAVSELFEQSLKELEDMFRSLDRIIIDDETFLYRAVKEIRKTYLSFRSIEHIPAHMQSAVQHAFYSLLKSMEQHQHHAWVVSKAHSRGRIKIEEITILSNAFERRKIRKQTIELDHMMNRIEPLNESIRKLKRIRTHEDIHQLYDYIRELLQLYHEELSNLTHIIHESRVLIRRTESLLRAIESEAEALGIKGLKKNVNSYAKRFHSLLLNIETQSRREYLDICNIVKHLPLPVNEAKRHHNAEVVDLAKERARRNEAAEKQRSAA